MNVPGAAARGEIAGLVFRVDQQRIRRGRVAREVQIDERRPERAAIRRVVRHHALREAVEGVNFQRHAIVEDAIARLQHGVLPAEWRPRQARPGSDTEGLGDALAFQARAEIERQAWRDRPVILREEGRFHIVMAVGAAAREIDALEQCARGIFNFDRTGGELPGVRGMRRQQAEFQLVRARVVDGRGRPGFAPLDSPRLALLGGEVVAGVPLRQQNHGARALCAHHRVEALDGNRAIQHALAQRQVVGDGAQVILLPVTGRDGLGVEEIRDSRN